MRRIASAKTALVVVPVCKECRAKGPLARRRYAPRTISYFLFSSFYLIHGLFRTLRVMYPARDEGTVFFTLTLTTAIACSLSFSLSLSSLVSPCRTFSYYRYRNHYVILFYDRRRLRRRLIPEFSRYTYTRDRASVLQPRSK